MVQRIASREEWLDARKALLEKESVTDGQQLLEEDNVLQAAIYGRTRFKNNSICAFVQNNEMIKKNK